MCKPFRYASRLDAPVVWIRKGSRFLGGGAERWRLRPCRLMGLFKKIKDAIRIKNANSKHAACRVSGKRDGAFFYDAIKPDRLSLIHS